MLTKSTEAAIACMSKLAENHCSEHGVMTAVQIAESRNLQRPFVAKVLTVLSLNGLIRGTPGPRGGYQLARSPSKISLLQIASCFERVESPLGCPFGPDFCGKDDQKCPIHDDLDRLRSDVKDFLSKTTLAVFCKGDD